MAIWSRLTKSWTLSFLAEHCRYMSLPSALRLRDFALRRARNELPVDKLLRLHMRRPFAGDIWLRQAGSDEYTFHEIVTKQVYARLSESVPGCRWILDIGGNIGLASRFFADAYPESTLFVVEPDAANYALLTRNLAGLIRSRRCRARRVAVWGSDCLLAVTPPPQGNRFDAIQVVKANPGQGDQTVEGVSMAEVLADAGFPHVDLMKVDIEGSEIELFKSDLGWLNRVNAIAIEFHQNSRSESQFDQIMERHGFAIDDSESHTVIATRMNKTAPGVFH